MTTLAEKLKKMIDRSKSRQRLPTYDESGRLICDPAPLKHPVGFKKPPTREEMLRSMLQQHQAKMALDTQYSDETDFDIQEADMLTPYEHSAHVYDMEPEIPVNLSREQDTPPSPEVTPSPSE